MVGGPRRNRTPSFCHWWFLRDYRAASPVAAGTGKTVPVLVYGLPGFQPVPILERPAGIEPASRAWKARALPLDDSRVGAAKSVAALERQLT